MTKALPGPYRVELNAAEVNASIYGKGRQHVAQVWSGRNPSMAVVKANAALLAASPVMLEAIGLVMVANGAREALSGIKLPDGRTGWEALWDASNAAQDGEALGVTRAKRGR